MSKITKFIINEFKDFSWFEWLLLVGSTVAIVVLSTIQEADIKTLLIAAFAGITGVWGVLFGGKGKISCFIFSTINQILYIIIAFDQPGGEILLSAIILGFVFYIPTNVIGYLSWFKKRDVNANVKPRKTSLLGLLISSLLLIVIYVGYSLILQYSGLGINQLWLDSMVLWTTVFAIILMVLRFIEQWVLWILQDVVLVVMWAIIWGQGQQNETAIIMFATYITYTIVAIYGYVNWIKLESKNPIQPYTILNNAQINQLSWNKKIVYHFDRIFSVNPQVNYWTLKHWK